MATCVIVMAILCVLVTAVAIIIAFATPNWVRLDYNSSMICDCSDCDCGLWLTCRGGFLTDGSIDNCRWFFSNEFEVEKKLPNWFQAVQGLMACSVLTVLMSLVVGLFSLCCYCNRCNPYQAAGAFVNLTFLLVAAAVCVIGVKGHLDHNIHFLEPDDPATPVAVFGWSFWTALGSAVMALISSALYMCAKPASEDEFV
jgi:ABC-type sugar transport system permease subunit